MSQYDNRGRVAIWKRDSDNPKAPTLSGHVVAHRDIREGETVEVALWNDKGHPKHAEHNPKAPMLTGRVSDARERDDFAPPDDFDDVPF